MKARYNFEHQIIPQLLFSKKHRNGFLMKLINDKEDFLLQVFNDLYEKGNKECPYSNKDISIHFIGYPEKASIPELYIIAIKMPEPKFLSQCSSVFICFDENMKNYMYFTKELEFDSSFMLCGWENNEIHNNYGEAPEGNEALFDRISSIFFSTQQMVE